MGDGDSEQVARPSLSLSPVRGRSNLRGRSRWGGSKQGVRWPLQYGQRLARGLLDLVFPAHCVVCGRLGAWLCVECQAEIHRVDPPLCPCCGRPWREGGLCPDCRASPHLIEARRFVAWHVSPLREALHALKYQGLRALGPPLAHLLVDVWERERISVDGVVPVPLHPRRKRRRGYNQAEVLARAFCQEMGLPLWGEVLVRKRDTPSQVGLTREERKRNVRGAFACHPRDLTGARILLIDDVCTTGATLEACAEPLLVQGAAAIYALTVARARPGQDVSR